MTQKLTFKELRLKYLEKKDVSSQDVLDFLQTLRVNFFSIKTEFKNKIEPAVFFNQDTKKLAQKCTAFMSIFDEIELGIKNLEESVSNEKDFEASFDSFAKTVEKLDNLKEEITELMKTMSPI